METAAFGEPPSPVCRCYALITAQQSVTLPCGEQGVTEGGVKEWAVRRNNAGGGGLKKKSLLNAVAQRHFFTNPKCF